jgi:hypothetical protein
MTLSARIKRICVASRLARFDRDVLVHGPREAKRRFEAMEKLINAPIRKRKPQKRTEKQFDRIESSADFLKRIEGGYQPDRLRNKEAKNLKPKRRV